MFTLKLCLGNPSPSIVLESSEGNRTFDPNLKLYQKEKTYNSHWGSWIPGDTFLRNEV